MTTRRIRIGRARLRVPVSWDRFMFNGEHYRLSLGWLEYRDRRGQWRVIKGAMGEG
jgi:hypothetical protein